MIIFLAIGWRYSRWQLHDHVRRVEFSFLRVSAHNLTTHLHQSRQVHTPFDYEILKLASCSCNVDSYNLATMVHTHLFVEGMSRLP